MYKECKAAIEASTPGRYEGETPMTAFVDEMFLNGDTGTDTMYFEDGSGYAQYGRRILSWSSTGFVTLDKFANRQQASKVMEKIMVEED